MRIPQSVPKTGRPERTSPKDENDIEKFSGKHENLKQSLIGMTCPERCLACIAKALDNSCSHYSLNDDYQDESRY